jgi:ribosomal protein S18 acetylase RimI-like enzyme
LTSGVHEIIVTKAELSDIDRIKHIADLHRKELGFVRRPALIEAIDRSEVLIAKQNGNIVGFVEYRHRRDEQTTLYNIAVTLEYRGLGIGRRLIQSLLAEAKERNKKYVSLKCPVDLVANQFYEILGFHLYEIEAGKQRRLKIWRWLL